MAGGNDGDLARLSPDTRDKTMLVRRVRAMADAYPRGSIVRRMLENVLRRGPEWKSPTNEYRDMCKPLKNNEQSTRAKWPSRYSAK